MNYAQALDPETRKLRMYPEPRNSPIDVKLVEPPPKTSMDRMKVKALELLLGGKKTTTEIYEVTRGCKSDLRRAMLDLAALGKVRYVEGKGANVPRTWFLR